MDKEFLDSIGARYTPPPQQAQQGMGQDQSMRQQPMEQAQPSMLETLGKYAGKFNDAVETSRLPKVAGGAIQGAYDVIKSGADLPLKLVGQSLPDVNLSKYGGQDAVSQLAFLAGRTATQGGGEYGLYKAASKIPGLAAKTLGATVGRGAAAGFVGGEEGPGGRLGSAVIGGVGAPLAELNSTGIANRVVSMKNDLVSKYATKYSDLFKNLKEKGVNTVDVPNINDVTIKKFRKGNDVLESINKFRENPTLENAHVAQSDLGKIERKAKNSKEYKESESVTPYSKRVDKLSAMRSAIQNSIKDKASSVGAPELGDLYKNISRGYAEEVAPYFNSAIKDYEYGNKSASKLVKELAKNDEFKLKAGKNHEELYRQAQLKKNVKKTAQYAAGAAGVYTLARLGLRNPLDNSSGDQ